MINRITIDIMDRFTILNEENKLCSRVSFFIEGMF